MKAVLILLLMVPACCLAQPYSSAAGTYELIVCKSTCSFENSQAAIARGVVVLFDNPLAQTDVEKLDPFHFAEPNEVIRACYAGEEFKDAQTYAFGTNIGTTSWSQKGTGAVLTFSLMRSIDAGYSVDVRCSDNGFSGKGTSWGAGVAAPRYGPDVVVGRRIGSADMAACTKTSVQSAP